MSVLISASHQCQSVLPINANQCCQSVPVSAAYQCASVPSISACQCRLTVPVSAAYQCCLSVPCISAAFQYPSVM
ncbi:unnamed protein product, partial [Staurois parvus]